MTKKEEEIVKSLRNYYQKQSKHYGLVADITFGLIVFLVIVVLPLLIIF